VRMGATITGRAREISGEWLKGIDLDSYLNEIGCYHAVRRAQALMDQSLAVTHVFERGHREMDTTTYGDSYKRSTVTTPGLYVELEDGPDARETKIVATMLLVEWLRKRLAAEQRGGAALNKELNKERGWRRRREADLLVFWDRMGKKARKTFATANPEVAERCEELEREREEERYTDYLEGYW
jgi:hypothetical protein